MGRLWWIRGVCFGLCVGPAVASAQASSDHGGWSAPAESAQAAGSVEATAATLDPAVIDRADADPRALSDFRPLLDRYGAWVDDARYGLVWVPSRQLVGDDFAPYLTRGHWALDTDANWVWVSDYAFGPVVFHYGRWVWVVGLGWAWVPGYSYGPAWVSWRVPMHDGLYVGWAPMPPNYVWVSGMAVGVGFYVVTPWVFCPSHYVFSDHLHRHHVRDPSRMKEAARQTQPYHPQVGKTGPSATAAGVPKSRMPVSRLPAQPRPAPRGNSLGRYLPAPSSDASKWQVTGERPRPVPRSGQPRSAPPLPASGRFGGPYKSGGLRPMDRGFGPSPMPAPRAAGVPVGLTPRAQTLLPAQPSPAAVRPTTSTGSAATIRSPSRPAPVVRSTR